MVSLIKPRKQGHKWRARVPDEHGKPHEVRLAYTKKESEIKLRKLLRESDEGGHDFNAKARLPIAEHIDGFKLHLESRNNSADYVQRIGSRLTNIFKDAGCTSLSDVRIGAFERVIAKLGKMGTLRTRNHYVDALKGFGGWLKGKASLKNPFQDFSRVYTKADPNRKQRGWYRPQELTLLLDAARRRGVERWLETHPKATQATLDGLKRKGEERARLYLFAAYSGLRVNECRTLRWRDCDLDRVIAPRVTVTEGNSKNSRAEPVNLEDWFADYMKQWRAEARAKPGDLVFRVPGNVLDMLYRDMDFARVPRIDESGKARDFHAFRYTFAATMVLVPEDIQWIRKQMRHASMQQTMDLYADLELNDLEGRARKGLPKPPSLAEAQKSRATYVPQLSAPRGESVRTDANEKGAEEGVQAHG